MYWKNRGASMLLALLYTFAIAIASPAAKGRNVKGAVEDPEEKVTKNSIKVQSVSSRENNSGYPFEYVPQDELQNSTAQEAYDLGQATMDHLDVGSTHSTADLLQVQNTSANTEFPKAPEVLNSVESNTKVRQTPNENITNSLNMPTPYNPGQPETMKGFTSEKAEMLETTISDQSKTTSSHITTLATQIITTTEAPRTTTTATTEKLNVATNTTNPSHTSTATAELPYTTTVTSITEQPHSTNTTTKPPNTEQPHSTNTTTKPPTTEQPHSVDATTVPPPPTTATTTTTEQPTTARKTTTTEQPITARTTTTTEQTTTATTAAIEQPNTATATITEQPTNATTTATEKPTARITTNEEPTTATPTTTEETTTATTTTEQPTNATITATEEPTTGKTTTEEPTTATATTTEQTTIATTTATTEQPTTATTTTTTEQPLTTAAPTVKAFYTLRPDVQYFDYEANSQELITTGCPSCSTKVAKRLQEDEKLCEMWQQLLNIPTTAEEETSFLVKRVGNEWQVSNFTEKMQAINTFLSTFIAENKQGAAQPSLLSRDDDDAGCTKTHRGTSPTPRKVPNRIFDYEQEYRG